MTLLHGQGHVQGHRLGQFREKTAFILKMAFTAFWKQTLLKVIYHIHSYTIGLCIYRPNTIRSRIQDTEVHSVSVLHNITS